MTELEILLPYGLPPPEFSADLLRELQTPALATLVARAKPEQGESMDGFHRTLPHESWIAHEFGFDSVAHGSPPVAEALMREMGLTPAASDAWFILQPVHIHIARDHLVLTDPRQLALDEQDARSLFEIAASLFAETDKQLLYGNAGTWFVRADDWGGLQTSTPDAASGHNIDIWMPTGPGDRNWRKIQNEVQMHWFNHTVNEFREARGLKPVNSLWLWGGPSSGKHSPPQKYDKTFNLSGWMQAFRNVAVQTGDARHAGELISQTGAHNLLLLDNLLEPALSNDWSRWLDAMRQLEEHWFAPLLQALKSGSVDQITLIITHDTRISRLAATRSSLRKFWVKPSLAPLCP
ncbi:hypothetical protein EGT07_20165 [Herbaspirillum sp. HC18]|nr:hypothetical protein EGT07_20165 [Herbaspirillum sp. HC18]